MADTYQIPSIEISSGNLSGGEIKARQYVASKDGQVIGNSFMAGGGPKKNRHLTVKCPNNHVWTVQVGSLAKENPSWCLACLRQQQSDEVWQRLLSKVKSQGGRCLTSTYLGSDVEHEFSCSRNFHKPWKATPSSVAPCNGEGSWCPQCSKINMSEEITRSVFVEAFNGVTFSRSRKIDGLEKLELDGVNEQLKIAFEYQGKQHSVYSPWFFKTEYDFEQQKLRDQRKVILCQATGIQLIVVYHTVSMLQLRTHIRSRLTSLGYSISNAIGTELDFVNQVRRNFSANDNYYAEIKEIVEGGESPKGSVISDQYVSSTVHMEFKCPTTDHPIFPLTPHAIKLGKFCPLCGIEKTKAALTFSDETFQQRVTEYGYHFLRQERVVKDGRNLCYVIVACCPLGTQEHRFELSYLKRGLTCVKIPPAKCSSCVNVVRTVKSEAARPITVADKLNSMSVEMLRNLATSQKIPGRGNWRTKPVLVTNISDWILKNPGRLNVDEL